MTDLRYTRQDCTQISRAIARRLANRYPQFTAEELLGPCYIVCQKLNATYNPDRGMRWASFLMTFAPRQVLALLAQEKSIGSKGRPREIPSSYNTRPDGQDGADWTATISDPRDVAHEGHDGRHVEIVQARADAESLVAKLPVRDRDIIHRRYFRGQTFRTIGRALKVTTQAVQQRHGEAIAQLRLEAGTKRRAARKARSEQSGSAGSSRTSAVRRNGSPALGPSAGPDPLRERADHGQAENKQASDI